MQFKRKISFKLDAVLSALGNNERRQTTKESRETSRPQEKGKTTAEKRGLRREEF